MNKNTKLRAFLTIPNKNICFPIGTTLAVQYFFEKLNFYDIFGKYKSKSHDINSLLIGLLGDKLTENFSIKEAKEIQKAITNKKDLPKKFRVNNELIEINYSFTTKLEELSDEEAIEFLKSDLITGREGFFCLKSKLRWRIPLQATGSFRTTAPNSVKGDSNPKQFSLSRS